MNQTDQHYNNVISLLKHSDEMIIKRNKLIEQYEHTDDMDTIVKMEEEIEFLHKYINTLQDQAVVIMNEHNIQNITKL